MVKETEDKPIILHDGIMVELEPYEWVRWQELPCGKVNIGGYVF